MAKNRKKTSAKNTGNDKVLEHPAKVAVANARTTQTAEPAVSWLKVPDESTLPPEVLKIFQEQREHIGFVYVR